MQHIRPATPADAAALAAVEVTSWQAAYRGLMPDAFLAALSPEDKADKWQRSLLKHGPTGRKRVLVAVEDAAILGFVRFGPAEETATSGLIYLLYVLPTAWGRGIGKALLRAALADLHTRCLHEAHLWVLRGNQRARRFYESRSWQPTGQTTSADYGGLPLEALCYRLAIAG